MYHFCTYFDRNYLSRGLALYQSLEAQCPSFRLYVLCMDQECRRILTQLKLPRMQLIALEELERGDAALAAAKANRSPVEYYFTCSPSLPLYILEKFPAVDLVTYLDADLYFFSSPAVLLEAMADASISLIPHRFPPALRHMERSGVYNVGWMSFRRDASGLACLRWWRERCIEWCYDRFEDGRYADQKYLDRWPELFEGVTVLAQKGANLAPWNISNYAVRLEGEDIRVDGEPLIFYHFHGLKRTRSWLYRHGLDGYLVTPTKAILTGLYSPYVLELAEIEHRVAPLRGASGVPENIRFRRPMSAVRIVRKVIRTLLPPYEDMKSHIVVWGKRVIHLGTIVT